MQKYADITDGEGNNVYSTRESQIDELVADSMFDVFTNKAAIERLAKNDRTLAQKIYDKFKDILNIIKSKLKLFDTMNNNPEIRALMNDADSLEQIVNKFHDALDVAKNNYNVNDSGKNAGNGQKNNADGTVMKAYSVNEDFVQKLEKWDKNTVGFSFIVGTTSDALIEAGIPKKQIRLDATKLKRTLNDHQDMTLDVIKQIPELLKNPIFVIDSKSNKDARIVMGDLYNENGKIVTVVLILNPKSKKR